MKNRLIQNFTAAHSDGMLAAKETKTKKPKGQEGRSLPTAMKERRKKERDKTATAQMWTCSLISLFLQQRSWNMTHFLWPTPYSITMAKISPAHKPSKHNAAGAAKTTSCSWNALLLKLEDQRLRIMRSRFSACVLALLHLCRSSGSYEALTLPDVGDPEFIEECVQTHNRLRSEVNPPASNMLYMVRGSSRLHVRACSSVVVFMILKDCFCDQMQKRKKKKKP